LILGMVSEWIPSRKQKKKEGSDTLKVTARKRKKNKEKKEKKPEKKEGCCERGGEWEGVGVKKVKKFLSL